MSNNFKIIYCPYCGKSNESLSKDLIEFKCQNCGKFVSINNNVENKIILENLSFITPDQVIQRVSRLFYLCKDSQAKCLLEKILIYYPCDTKLLELENQCDCFLTRDFGNYLKMLSVRTFLTKDEIERYKTEINGFCKMLGNKAINSLNIAMQRSQNKKNYEALLNYIVSMKKCLQNKVIIQDDSFLELIKLAVLKLIAIVCNTIYIKSPSMQKEYIMLIDLKQRRRLKEDFDSIDLFGETEYKIVDESVIKKYIFGGRNE